LKKIAFTLEATSSHAPQRTISPDVDRREEGTTERHIELMARAALGWFHQGHCPPSRYWRTPPVLYRKLSAEFHLDFDPCPAKGWNALPWSGTNFINLPFRKDDVVGKGGAMAIVRKAIAEQIKGKASVIVMPVLD
jgi:hypothetical protein